MTVAVTVVGLRLPVRGGVSEVHTVAAGLALAWGVAGLTLIWRLRSPGWLVVFGALVASVAIVASRVAEEASSRHHWDRSWRHLPVHW